MAKRKTNGEKTLEELMSWLESNSTQLDFDLHDNIDRDRLVWDQNYRKKVKDFLNDEVTKLIYKKN